MRTTLRRTTLLFLFLSTAFSLVAQAVLETKKTFGC